MRRPINGPVTITGDRATHAAYNVGPATDYAVPVGTPVVAPFAGRLTKYTTSTGGLGVVLRGDDATFYGQHLWVRLPDGAYAEGDRIALSGNTGTQTTGPHLHCYVIVHKTGERLSMEEYLTRIVTTGIPTANTSTPIQEDEMPDSLIISSRHPDRNGIFLAAPGHFHQFTGEEWAYAQASGAVAGIKIVDVADNPRAFDLLRNIYQSATLTADQVKAVVQGVIGAGVAVDADVDYAAIAKAVNDDAAKRLSR